MVVLCATELIIAIVSKQRDCLKRLFVTYATSGVLAVCFFGFNPYMTNVIRHGNVGWPIAGENHAVDIISRQIHPKFAFHDRFYKFVVGYNAFCSNSQTEYPRLKFPGQTSINELKVYGEDTRIGGFGALFDVVLLVTVALVSILILKKKLTRGQVVMLVGLVCSVFVNPECWWARYVPQLWLICMLVFIYTIWVINGRWRRYMCLGMALLLTINYGVSATEQLRAYTTRSFRLYAFNQRLLKAQKDSKVPAYVNFGVFYSKTASILDRKGIAYRYFNPTTDKLPQGYKLVFKDKETLIYLKQ